MANTVERTITLVALINAAIFYAFIIVVFITTRKTRLNYSLAVQKAFWLAIIVALALPTWWTGNTYVPDWGRMLLWSGLSIATWWVLLEVYRANWSGNFRQFIRHIWCTVSRRCKVENLWR